MTESHRLNRRTVIKSGAAAIAMPAPDRAIIARRDEIAAGLAAIVGSTHVIVAEDERRAYENICRYWAEAYDWRAREAALNRFDQFVTTLDGLDVHFIHARSPHREALPPSQASDMLSQEARAGRLDANSVAAVLEAAGQHPPRLARPAGLTEREAEVVGLLARGLQTKQIARALGISIKTADRHVQNAYAKIGVSTRAAATVFAMQHGLAAWGELPMVGSSERA